MSNKYISDFQLHYSLTFQCLPGQWSVLNFASGSSSRTNASSSSALSATWYWKELLDFMMINVNRSPLIGNLFRSLPGVTTTLKSKNNEYKQHWNRSNRIWSNLVRLHPKNSFSHFLENCFFRKAGKFPQKMFSHLTFDKKRKNRLNLDWVQ